MIIADALAETKRELDIKTTDFDTDITAFVNRSIKRLFPYVQSEVTDSTVSIVADQWTFTLPATCESIRFMYDFSGYRIEDFIQHNREIILKEVPSEGALKIYGNGRYTITTLPAEFEEAIIYYSCALFYSFLTGNKRKYNMYTNTGTSGVNNMRETAQWYEQRANTYLQDRGILLGLE